MLLDIGTSSKTHWRYSIVAMRALRTLIRKEVPILPRNLKYFMEETCNDNPSIVRFHSLT